MLEIDRKVDNLRENEVKSYLERLEQQIDIEHARAVKKRQLSVFNFEKVDRLPILIAGSGMLNIELLFFNWIGFDLSKNSYAMNETIRIIVRTVVPFVVFFLVAFYTK